MKRIMLLSTIFSAIFLTTPGLYDLNAQQITKGNLLKININNTEISLKDTTGFWESTESGSYSTGHTTNNSRYYDHIEMPSNKYFLKWQEQFFDSPYMEFNGGNNSIESENLLKVKKISRTKAGMDVFTPYMYEKTKLIRTNSGLWLINGELGNAFLFNNDSLAVINDLNAYGSQKDFRSNFISIIGKIGEKPLAVFRGTGAYGQTRYEFFLLDQAETPDMDSSKARKIIFKDNSASNFNWLYGIIKLPGKDLYLAETNMEGFCIYSFSNDTLRFQKQVVNTSYSRAGLQDYYRFKNNSLYLLFYESFQKYDYDSTKMEFVNGRVISDGFTHFNADIDRNFHYLARTEQDSLVIFDINLEKVIRRYSLAGIDSPSNPFIDSPYVYIHQVRYKYTSADDKVPGVIGSYRLSAYPNPFNSMAKIFYTLPEDKQIEISIFDMLGRKVRSLVNGFEKKGDHTVTFNANSLPSGIYFYNLTAAGYSRTEKIVLMK